MDKLYDDLLVELECPVCMMYMAPPILQCLSGHSICTSCRSKLLVCPLCQNILTQSKNYSLEALARKMQYPCANAKIGCTARLKLDEREMHEWQCAFNGYKCHYIKCSWTGKHDDLLDHWNHNGHSSKTYNCSNVCHTKLQKAEMFYVNIVKAYGELFWYKFKYCAGKLAWAIQYIGPRDKAADFYFEIEIFKPGQPLRRVLLSDYCQPLDIDNKMLHTPGFSVLTTTEAISHLIGDDQLLIYYMKIKEFSYSKAINKELNTPPVSSVSLNSVWSKSGGDAGAGAGAGARPKTKKYYKKNLAFNQKEKEAK